MTNLTVGYVSGMIAAAIYLLQLVLPNAIVLVLVGFLRETHSAVSWSSVQHTLASSLWPTILRTDAARTRQLHPRVQAIDGLRQLAALLLTVAAVITPLGLTDAIAPEGRTRNLRFSYVEDLGPMGYGTPPISGLGFARKCGDFYPIPCPGTTPDIIYSGNATTLNYTVPNNDIDVRIPRILASLYQSGLKSQPQTVSSFFDIQSRQYSYSVQGGINHNERYVVDAYRSLDTLLLDDTIEAVNGLIVDTINGGVAFRNHTAPLDTAYGAEWVEDLLFIQPETSCVNLNISFEFLLPYNNLLGDEIQNLSMVDEGGFANFYPHYPKLDYSGAQEDPQLRNRAYIAGWLTNALNMVFMNVTRPDPHAFAYINSNLGKKFALSDTALVASYRFISASDSFETLMNPEAYSVTNSSDIFANLTLPPLPKPLYTNPFNVTIYNYSDINTICQGAGGQDLVDLNHIAVACGLVFGAAVRKDGQQSLVFDPNTWWTQPIYTCASTSKASIKSVHLKWNATVNNGVKGLQILNVTEKSYASRAEMPVWGTEHLDNVLADVTPLWGLIDPKMKGAVNLSTVQSNHFYLPGFAGAGFVPYGGYEYLPATNAPSSALSTIYQVGYDNDDDTTIDYSGSVDIAMFKKWQELTRNEDGAAKMLNLIYTDLLANALMGTKSWNSGDKLPPDLLQRRDDGDPTASDSTPSVPVTIYTRQIRYKWAFAIPALILLLLTVVVLCMASVLSVTGRATPSRVRHFLHHLSAGRLFTTYLYPGECDGLAPTKEWLDAVGRKNIHLDRDAHFASRASGDEVADADDIPLPDLKQRRRKKSSPSSPGKNSVHIYSREDYKPARNNDDDAGEREQILPRSPQIQNGTEKR